jgi:lipoprotein-releasing system ATP-binding protein
LLNLSHINQQYIQGDSTVNVLSNLSLTVNKAMNVGIVGPSGSGKSTLLNILGMIEKPSSGKYLLDGKNCFELSDNDKTKLRRRKIGFVFQNNQLLEDFNILENIALPLILNGISKNKAEELSSDFLKTLGLEKRENFKPGVLSGGEQQRVAIARALIKKPILLLADEPTGSLDEKNSDYIIELILSLSKKNKTTSIIATHNLDIIKKLDISFKIEKGKLIEFKK